MATTSDKSNALSVDSAIERARALCKKRGARLTRLREKVLLLIWQCDKPLGAYALMDLLAENSDREKVAPPTVYRALDFLMEEGLGHKVHSLNAYLRCTNPPNNHRDTLFICKHCGIAEEIPNNSIQQAINLSASQHRFTVEQQMLEIVGRCQLCKKDGRK